MTISEFTKPELDYFRQNCNFVNLEIKLFEERAKGISLQQIAEDLHISYDYARQLSRKVNKKILKVL
jgi:orotate phosphoribosyltransferase-like protein